MKGCRIKKGKGERTKKDEGRRREKKERERKEERRRAKQTKEKKGYERGGKSCVSRIHNYAVSNRLVSLASLLLETYWRRKTTLDPMLPEYLSTKMLLLLF